MKYLFNIQGVAGAAPSANELVIALEDHNHNMYMYFGHSSGKN